VKVSDLIQELRSAEFDWIDCNDEENASLVASAISRITALENACQAYLDA
jgi:thiamine pyrophosphate-dependent acetolactate synthase large subunit-like protein